MSTLKIGCPDCGKTLKEIPQQPASMAHLRRMNMQLVEKHKREGQCNPESK